MTESQAKRPRGLERGLVWAAIVLGGVIAYHLALLFAQVRYPFPFLNDSVLHFGLIQSIESAPARGQSLLDPWVSTWCMGFPVFHYYQNLPHLFVVGLYQALMGSLSLVQTFKLVEWVALGTFPLPVYLGMRALRFDRVAAVSAGILSVWIRTNYLHGHDYESYVWQGLGQYTQIIGGWFFPLAVGYGCTALRDGRGYTRAAVLLAVTFLCHLAVGYMAYIAVGLYALIAPREAPRRLLRLLLVAGVSIAASLYMVIPIFRDFAFYNVSSLVPSWKYNSFGHAVIFPWLFGGDLFDFERPPVLTLLVGAGLVALLMRCRRESERLLLVLFVFFFLLYLGRPTWGSLLNLLPLGKGFHFSRAIFVVHVVGVMGAGVALSWMAGALARRGRWGVALAVLAACAIAVVPLRERTQYLQGNAALVQEAAEGYAAEKDDLEAALAVAREDRLGRVYAGQGRPGQAWGGDFQVGWVPVYAWFPVREMDALGYLHHMWSLNSDFQDHFDERRADTFRAFNVRRIIAPVGRPVPPFATEIARHGRFRVLSVDGPGFVELVDAPFTVAASKRTVAGVHRKWVRSQYPKLGLYPVLHLEEEGPTPENTVDGTGVDFRLPPPPAAAPPAGEVLQVTRTGDDFDATVRVDRPSHLVLKMTYHPRWQVLVDGEPVDTVHLVPSYVAVPLDPGEHRVHFRWNPGRLKLLLLLAGLVPTGTLLLIERRRSP